MLTVKLLGGAKKLFSSDKLEIPSDSMTVSKLLTYLEKNTLENMPPFDIDKILVAINGVDSSALQGKDSVLKEGDVISIIPVVHGGTSKRISFKLMKNMVEIIRLKKTPDDPIQFIESLRKKYPDIVIQGIRASFVLNAEHAKKIISVSLSAQRADTLLSNKIETDILMRFACTRQIIDAISKVGVKKKTDSILVIIGNKSYLNKLFNEIEDLLTTEVFSKDNSRLIKKEFGITKKQLDSVLSKTPLEDILVERSTVLFH